MGCHADATLRANGAYYCLPNMDPTVGPPNPAIFGPQNLALGFVWSLQDTAFESPNPAVHALDAKPKPVAPINNPCPRNPTPSLASSH